MKSFGRTGIAAAIVLVISAYAYFVEYKGGEKEKQKQEEAEKLVQLDKDSVNKIEIERAGKIIRLEKTGSQWKVLEPVNDLADASQVDQFLSSLTSEKSKETVAEGAAVDWKSFGLDQPVGHIKITAGEKSINYIVGTVKAYDSSNYLRLDQENKVRLGSASWDSFLNKLPQEFRDKRMLRVENVPLYDHLEVVVNEKNRKSRVELKRTDGIWRPVGSKDAFPIAGDKVVAFIDSVKNLRANEFLEGEAAKDTKSLQAPEIVIRFKEGANAPFELKVSSPTASNASKVYVVSSGVQAVASFFKTATDGLKKDLNEFFDKKLPFGFESSQAQKLTLEVGKAVHEFKKEGDKWKLVNTTEKDRNFEAEKVVDLLSKMSRLEATDIMAAVPKGSTPFKLAGKMDVSNEKGESLLHVRWSELKDKKVSALTNKTERLVTVADTAWSTLPLDKILVAKAPPPNPDTPKKESSKASEPNK